MPAFTSETQRSVVELVQERVATAMGLHLAAAVPRLAYPSHLMGPLKYRQQITNERVEVVDGHIAVPRGAGLGVTVDEKFLRELDLRRR